MTLKSLNGRKVRIGIKNGLSVRDFCQKYECGEEELRERIRQLFTVEETAGKVWNEIRNNEKKSRRKVETTIDTPNVVDETPKGEEVKSDTHIPSLEELKEQELIYSNDVIELEKTYKGCYQEREEGRKRYRKLRDEIQELKTAYNQRCQEVKKIIQNDNDTVKKMNEICDLYRSKRAALEAIRSNIEEMSKIVICVYSDHEIAPFDEEMAETWLDDTGHGELFDRLREREEAEDFRPRDLRVIARIMKIVENLDAPVEIIFEEEELREAYEVFSK